MAIIKPFCAIHPNPFYADQLIFTKPQVESVSGDITLPDALHPLKTLLETGARQRPETPEGQQLAFDDINITLKSLLEGERLWLDHTPGIYIYEITHPGYSQVGVWALADLDQSLKTHELTFDDSVRRIKNYRENTGLEGSPILLTYLSNPIIDQIIAANKSGFPDVRYESAAGIHKLWKIEKPEVLQQLISAFSQVEASYLADGHHRKRSAELLLAQQKKAGKPVFNTITALFMSADELKIRKYNRVVIPDQPINRDEFFKQLLPHFYIHGSRENKPVQPVEERNIGLFIGGKWFNLKAKPKIYNHCSNHCILDVSILQDYILAPIFDITNPATDLRLKHVGGEKAMTEMEAIFAAHPHAIGFNLCPVTVSQLTAVADAEINLPPKSTWIDPKIPYGLLLYKH